MKWLAFLLTVVSMPAWANSVQHNNFFDIFTVANYQTAVQAKKAAKSAVPFSSGHPFTYSDSHMEAGSDDIHRFMREDYNYRLSKYGPQYSAPPQPRYDRAPSRPINLGSFSGSAGNYGGSRGGDFSRSDGTCQPVAKDPALVAQARRAIASGQGCMTPPAAHPQKVTFEFSGLLGDYWMAPIVRGMTGRANVRHEYFPHHQVSDEYLMHSAICAYQLATRKYRGAHGSPVYSPISIVGHSLGGDAAHRMAVILGKLGVAVDVVVTADARQPGLAATFRNNQPDWGRPCNVARWDNYYETGDMLRGFWMSGANNIEVDESHMSIPGNNLLRQNTAAALAREPSCRKDFGLPSYYGNAGSCDPGERQPASAPTHTAEGLRESDGG